MEAKKKKNNKENVLVFPQFFTDKSYIPFPVLDLAYDDTKCDNSTDDSGLDMLQFVPEANFYDGHSLDRDVRFEE